MNFQVCDSLCVGPRQGFFVEHLKAITKTMQSQWVENEEVVTEKEAMIWQSRHAEWAGALSQLESESSKQEVSEHETKEKHGPEKSAGWTHTVGKEILERSCCV